MGTLYVVYTIVIGDALKTETLNINSLKQTKKTDRTFLEYGWSYR